MVINYQLHINTNNFRFVCLGHEVEEIRVRALKNILFKLDHKLVCAVDLVHEKQLLINLLKWFNFPNPPLKSEVLRILQTLSKVGSFVFNNICHLVQCMFVQTCLFLFIGLFLY